MKRTKFLIVAAALALAAFATPAMSADTPEGMRCPVSTMDGKWVEATNVNRDCVAQPLHSAGGGAGGPIQYPAQ